MPPDDRSRPTPQQGGSQEQHQDQGSTLLATALDWAAAGVAVFPCQPLTKVPATPHGFKDATTDPDKIRAWWKRWPNANPAAATGAVSNLVVLDPDNGIIGQFTLERLEEELGQLPPTLTVTTPGDPDKGKAPGRHIYLAHPGQRVKNRAGEKWHPWGKDQDPATGLDVRGDGGYVMLPGSVLHSGTYTIENGAAEVAGYGEKWRQLLTTGTVSNGTRPEPSKTTNDDEHLDQTPALFDKPARSFTREQAQQYVNDHAMGPLRDAKPGGRNHALNNAAMVLGHFVPHFLAESKVVAILTACAEHIGLDDGEIGPTIASGLAAGMAEPYTVTDDDQALDVVERRSRRVNLRPYLDGTYTPPEPSIGAERSDHVRLLYPAKWHTVIGLTGCGKSWFAVWNAAHELEQGNTVVYLHFEEAGPADTLARFQALGVDQDTLDARLVWLETDGAWTADAFRAELEDLDQPPALVILDGINDACTLHKWPIFEPEGVGNYRATFVKPAAKLGAAVLSLGHPPKARDRQTERHGYGATGWLDLVDGVGFRMEAGKNPVQRGHRGYARLYVVKDRAGGVARHGIINGRREAGWWELGTLLVDDSETVLDLDQDRLASQTTVHLQAPVAIEAAGDGDRDQIDDLADAIVHHLAENGGRYSSLRQLRDGLRAAKVKASNDDMEPALVRLEKDGRIEREPEDGNRPRPGRLTDHDPDHGPAESGPDHSQGG
jgi:Bifunctional DNA primase/polymerase, N-terminal